MTKFTKKAAVAFLKEKLTTDPRWAIRALIVLYEKQTADEQRSGETTEHNTVGFSGVDAEILTSFAKFYRRAGFLTPKQMTILFRKIGKYAGQMYRFSDEERLQKRLQKAMVPAPIPEREADAEQALVEYQQELGLTSFVGGHHE